MKKILRFMFGTFRRRIIFTVAFVHAVLMSAFIIELIAHQNVILLQSQTDHAVTLAEALSTSGAEWIAAKDTAGLQELVEAQSRYSDIEFIYITDKVGRVLAGTDRGREGQFILDLPKETQVTMLANSLSLVDVAVPAMIGDQHVGWVRLGEGQGAIKEQLAQVVRDGFYYIIAAILVGSVFAWFLGYQLSKRLYAVQETMNAVRAGNDAARVLLTGNDETTEIAREFNFMLDELSHREEKLRKSEENYRALIEQASDGVFIANAQGEYIDVNPKALEMLGYSREELLRLSIKELVAPEDQTHALLRLQEIRKGKGVISERYLIRKDGKLLPVEIAGSMLSDGRILGITRDITERKQAEENLLKSEIRYRSFIELTGQLGWVTNSVGEVEEDIPSYRKFTGQTYEEVKGRGWVSLIHPDDKEYTFQVWNRAVDTKSRYEVEYRLRRSDGIYRHFLSVGVPVFDENNNIREWIGTCMDITERKHADEKLREREEQNQFLLDNTSDFIARYNRDGVMVFGTKASSRFNGYQLEELINTSAFERIHPEDKEDVLQKLHNVIERGIETRTEYRVRRKDGDYIWVEASGRRVVNMANEPEVIVAQRDITERKKSEEIIRNYTVELEKRVEERTEELMQANQAKDAFLAAVSHELRTPLTPIMSFAGLLLEGYYGPVNEKQIHSLKTIEESGRRLQSLIGNVLDVSVLESGKFFLDFEEVSVNELCQASLFTVKEIAEQKKIELIHVAVPPTLRVHGDPKRLKQILHHLLNNAIKFTADFGSVRLDVSEIPANGQIRFSVSDTGVGIPPGDMEKIFKPFVQIDHRLTRQYGGTGLGLTLVRKLVELHGGSIQVRSELGKGSCFTVNLPSSSPSGTSELVS